MPVLRRASRTRSCWSSSMESTSSVRVYPIRIFLSKRSLMITKINRSMAELTTQPSSWEKNWRKSVPPPRKLMRMGVCVMIKIVSDISNAESAEQDSPGRRERSGRSPGLGWVVSQALKGRHCVLPLQAYRCDSLATLKRDQWNRYATSRRRAPLGRRSPS